MPAFDSSLQENAIVTIDAMGTQTAIAAKIVDGAAVQVQPT